MVIVLQHQHCTLKIRVQCWKTLALAEVLWTRSYVTSEFKVFGQPNGFFVGVNPPTQLNIRFSKLISLIVSASSFETIRNHVYAKHNPTDLLPLYTTENNDVGVLSANKSEGNLSYLLGYCSPKLGYFGATVPLFGEFNGPLTINTDGGRDNNCNNIQKPLCYGWAKSSRYHVADLLKTNETLETLTYSKLTKNLIPLMPPNPDNVKTCAQLGNVLNQVDVNMSISNLCDSLTPLYSLRNKKWWFRTFTVQPDPVIHNVFQNKTQNIVGYCAKVKGDCYANAALYIVNQNEKTERFEISKNPNGKLLCYVW
ncbi:unnamed protein product [Bursaphelenchus okinawaensis]|uniref:Uncharacterized protein n=1 Tax=Bursaphelenchus okinawaensis TaxID=465554 RepID=A0A811KTA4_9BILA|nr:unnamed protein product [Bursaphelenchus okinawaensis]CAG9109221.1 unnamed protein product [Bursaphelenchus okinawaensis]